MSRRRQALGALTLAGCGASGGSYANKPRPPTPVNLTVYINDSRVSVSPSAVGAGPVVFIVTNQASKTQSLAISSSGFQGSQVASTGPINPQATATVTVDFTNPGDYSVAASTGGQTQAQQANSSSIAPATIHVGTQRPNASNELLQP
jgi:hypothetical protein